MGNEINPEDKELLDVYLIGWNNELDGSNLTPDYDGLKAIAYAFGRLDALYGDDVSSIDLQSNEEILKKIKEHSYE